MKKYLFIIRRPPNQGIYANEALDMILTSAAFDQTVALLFIDDGVLQLKDQQQPESMHLKDIPAIYQALDLYNVDTVYVEEESLLARGLQQETLFLETKTVNRQSLSRLLQEFDFIIPE